MLHDPLPGAHRVAVLGLGASGLAAARLLALFGKEVVASDSRTDLDHASLRQRLPKGAELTLGAHPLEGTDAVVISPGIPPSAAIVNEARALGLEVLAEIELAARATSLPMAAITGTDGKTTTTMMTAAILRAAGREVGLGGNIGTPLCDVLADAYQSPRALDVLVVEVSAFQLAQCPTFRPRVLIATNIAEDHVEYFKGDWDAYVAAKRRPLRVMGPDDVAVLNADDRHVGAWDRHTRARVLWYGLGDPAPLAGHSDGHALAFRAGEAALTLGANDISFRGRHNHYNALAAGLGAHAMGASFDDVGRGLRNFEMPPHRIELVRTLDGITYINDSKATNPHAAMAGLTAVDSPTVLIAGGVDKGLELDAWVARMGELCSAVVAIGDLAPRLTDALRDHLATTPSRSVEVALATTMDDAVAQARRLAERTNAATVLLSPGCSSFDMFDSYGHRGEVFRTVVQGLKAS